MGLTTMNRGTTGSRREDNCRGLVEQEGGTGDDERATIIMMNGGVKISAATFQMALSDVNRL